VVHSKCGIGRDASRGGYYRNWPAAGFTDGSLSNFRSPFKLNRA